MSQIEFVETDEKNRAGRLGRIRRHRVRSVLTAVTVAATALTSVTVGPAGASAGDLDPTFGTSPGDTLVDLGAASDSRLQPVEPPHVALTCEAGELDVNHASADLLASSLGIDMDPAQRAVSLRPHFSVQDLQLAAGVGPGRIKEILATQPTCATPMAVPPVTPPDVCTSAEQVDFQLDDRESLASLLKSDPAVDRVLEWRAEHPFPTIQHAMIVAGIGPGNFKKIQSDVCITPASFDALDPSGDPVDYEWIYSASGGNVVATTDSDFRLDVPAGAISDPVGSWASITVLPALNELADYPRADMHIEAPWDGNVIVTLPVDPIEHADPANQNLLWHQLEAGSDEWEMFDSSSAVVTPDAISAPVTDLSVFESIASSTIENLSGSLRWVTGTFVSAPDCGNAPEVEVKGAPLEPVGVTGASVKWCATYAAVNNGTANVTLRNASQLLVEFQDANDYFDDEDLVADPTGTLFELVTSSIFGTASPGAEIGVEVTAEYTEREDRLIWQDGFASLELDPHELASLINAVLTTWAEPVVDWLDDVVEKYAALLPFDVRAQFVAQLVDVVDESFEAGLVEITNCFIEVGTVIVDPPGSVDAWLIELRKIAEPCVVGAFTILGELFDAAKELGIDFGIDPSQAGEVVANFLSSLTRNAISAERIVKSASAISQYAPIATALQDFMFLALFDSTLITIEVQVQKPTTDPTTGLPISPPCLSQNQPGDWILDRNCQRLAFERPPVGGDGGGGGDDIGLPAGYITKTGNDAWFFNTTTQQYHSIPTGGDYECLVLHYYVDWAAPAPSGSALSDEPFGCPDGNIPPLRETNGYLTPDGLLSSVRVLRESNGTSWIVWGGDRYEIQSPREFFCWVAPDNNLVLEFDVWDYVTQGQLDRFPVAPEGNAISNCAPPQF